MVKKVLDNVYFTLNKGDKVAFIGRNDIAMTTLFKILMGEMEPDSGSFKWGVTTSQSYFPRDNSKYFENSDYNLVEWLRQFSPQDESESFLRGFLGRMLFSGEEVKKNVSVLSGGEKVRCMLSKMMLSGANVITLDDPTNHLDLESITALNNGLIAFKGTILFTSHDHQFVQTIANRIIEVTPNGVIDKEATYDEFLENEELQKTSRCNVQRSIINDENPRSRFESEGFFINCILWIVNNYSKIILLKERDLNVVHRRMAEA